ncbi:MAG: S1 RNA-binding domain-containing protein [Oscillospiraceae bacterium]|nr:S1 RNA-binding domain-containing protein [Oscillospiraceae bacterium]
MQLEVGKIVEGTVTGITNFGAFVDIDGARGMVHISEISATFVKDVSQVLEEGQAVKVKILKMGDDGKMSLSIKAAQAPPARNDNSDREDRGPQTFEDKLNKFKQSSEEKTSDLKRRMDSRRGPAARRGPK